MDVDGGGGEEEEREGGKGLVQDTRSRTRTYKTYVENCWDVISHGSQQRRYNILKSMYMHPRVYTLSVIHVYCERKKEREIYKDMRVSCNICAQRQL